MRGHSRSPVVALSGLKIWKALPYSRKDTENPMSYSSSRHSSRNNSRVVRVEVCFVRFSIDEKDSIAAGIPDNRSIAGQRVRHTHHEFRSRARMESRSLNGSFSTDPGRLSFQVLLEGWCCFQLFSSMLAISAVTGLRRIPAYPRSRLPYSSGCALCWEPFVSERQSLSAAFTNKADAQHRKDRPMPSKAAHASRLSFSSTRMWTIVTSHTHLVSYLS